MRKLFVLLAVCTMAVSAVAADITFTVVQNDPGTFTIRYTTAAGAEPVGMGIKVSLTDATISSATQAVGSAQFPVALDFASGDPDNYEIGMATQTVLADPCQAGVPVLTGGISEFSICMGRLDPDTAAPTTLDLVTITVDDGDCVPFDVAISADNLRGGVVGADWDNVYFTGASDLACAGPSFTGPACWLSPTQCRGDVNGNAFVDTSDWPNFRDGFNKTYPNAAYLANACADYNQDGKIDTSDWPAFRDNFNKSVAADCVQPQGTWPPL